jgi:hypothetical protein
MSAPLDRSQLDAQRQATQMLARALNSNENIHSETVLSDGRILTIQITAPRVINPQLRRVFGARPSSGRPLALETMLMFGAIHDIIQNRNSTENLPASALTVRDIEKLKEKNCSICMEEFKLEEEYTVLPCIHGFHTGCIRHSIDEGNERCPLCRANVFQN